MTQTLHTDSETASDADASDEQPAFVDGFHVFLSLLRFCFGFTRGGHATHNLSSLPGLAFFCNQLAYGRLVIRRAVEMATLGS